MPRRPRLLLPGVPLHITHRGHNKRACFFIESDYLVYLSLLSKNARATGCALHAYVLMTNHIHLLTSFDDIKAAPTFVKLLAQQYSAYVNKRLDRTGSLWQGRYFSCPVPTEDYFLICHRYIEHNPVRAEMVPGPGHYPWSSFRGNAGFVSDRLLSPHDVYLQLGRSEEERYGRYRQLAGEALCETKLDHLRTATRSNLLPGEERRSPGRAKKPTQAAGATDILT